MPSEKSPHFFDREPDGTVRLRLRFTEEQADAIEEAAGKTPLVHYVLDAIVKTAKRDAVAARRSRPQVRPLE